MNAVTRWQKAEFTQLCDRVESLSLHMQALHHQLQTLSDATTEMTKHLGTRLTRTEVRNRLDVSNYTLNKMMAEKRFPRPGADAKWLLTEIIEWEIYSSHR